MPEGIPLPEHPGDIWSILQDIAREEDPRFRERSVAEHYNSSAEGMRDVKRWLAIYERRLDPSSEYLFPEGSTRHRGYVLVERNWPDGLRWDAFHAETLIRAPLPQALDEESLKKALDAYLKKLQKNLP